jgi:hypothetical protein
MRYAVPRPKQCIKTKKVDSEHRKRKKRHFSPELGRRALYNSPSRQVAIDTWLLFKKIKAWGGHFPNLFLPLHGLARFEGLTSR